MNTSLFELFKIGIGPSSSHTVGPMRAALRFANHLVLTAQLASTTRVLAELYGSLALTGVGHGTDRAILLGLAGCAPDTIDPATIDTRLATIRATHALLLAGSHAIPFNEPADLLFHRDQMYPPPSATATHPNGIRLSAFDISGTLLVQQTFFSIGGGFIVSAESFNPDTPIAAPSRAVPHPFRSARELLASANRHELSIAGLMLANEIALLADPAIPRPPLPASTASIPEHLVETGVLALFRVMQASAERGLITEGILPGGLNVRRRAPRLARRLRERAAQPTPDPLAAMDWVNVYAMAVNEENAAGGRVVTAPTNGAAGVIPAIALYLLEHVVPSAPLPAFPARRTTRSLNDPWDGQGRNTSAATTAATSAEPALTDPQRTALLRFFLTAAAIGILYKENASISGAEVGCQGEVGVACSMAAGGLAAALGGTNAQIEHAAEIGMEHNLGMTCDPIGGLVQIPCIERNGMGAVKAINAARLALADTDTHKLSLDQVIDTMYRTGLDMQSRYKETSLGGLALNIIEC